MLRSPQIINKLSMMLMTNIFRTVRKLMMLRMKSKLWIKMILKMPRMLEW